MRNMAGAEVKTRQTADGNLQIDLIKASITSDIMRGGNPLAKSFEQAYGTRRVGR